MKIKNIISTDVKVVDTETLVESLMMETFGTEDSVFKAKLTTILNESLKDMNIAIRGDDVMVGSKKVGELHIDLNNINAGIDFKAVDGGFSKEFQTIKDLVAFLKQRYGADADDSDGEFEPAKA